MSTTSRLFWFACLTLSCLRASAQPADELPPPSEHDSHKAYKARLDGAEDEAYAQLTGLYDAFVHAHPNDVVAAVERCRFMLSASSDDDGELFEGDWADNANACLTELGVRFPFEPKVVLLRAEQSWGDERKQLIEAALDNPLIKLTDSMRGRLHKLLAEQLYAQGKLPEAANHALRAQALLPAVDVALILGAFEHSRGREEAAVAQLARNLEATREPHQLLQKAQQLAELSAFHPALSALDLYDQRDPEYRDANLRGRIYEGLGRTKDARAAYKQDQNALNITILRRLFELDLAHGSASDAAAAYEALRDRGYDEDPIARNRLRLLWAHPTLPFHARDVWGLLTLLGVLCGAALLPMLLFAPIHYRGLVLRERNRQAPSPSRFSLRSAWRLCALLLLGQIVTLYVFGGDLLHADWFDMLGVDKPSQVQLARLALAGASSSLLITVGFFHRQELARLFAAGAPGSTGNMFRSLRIALAVAMLNGAVAGALGLLPKQSAIADLVSTQELVVAVLQVCGGVALLFVLAICAPFAEELLFRGALLDAFERHLSGRTARIVQAALFASLHDAWMMWPTLFTIGYQAARLRRQSGSLRASIALHMTWNGTIALFMIAADKMHVLPK